jgi:hypothetical protein
MRSVLWSPNGVSIARMISEAAPPPVHPNSVAGLWSVEAGKRYSPKELPAITMPTVNDLLRVNHCAGYDTIIGNTKP